MHKPDAPTKVMPNDDFIVISNDNNSALVQSIGGIFDELVQCRNLLREQDKELTIYKQIANQQTHEAEQRLAALECAHKRIRDIKKCQRFNLGRFRTGPPMYEHRRGEWIRHDDMVQAAALPPFEDDCWNDV